MRIMLILLVTLSILAFSSIASAEEKATNDDFPPLLELCNGLTHMLEERNPPYSIVTYLDLGTDQCVIELWRNDGNIFPIVAIDLDQSTLNYIRKHYYQF